MKETTYFRRCHVCGTVSLMPQKSVDRCQCCKKHLAPFFYFDEKKLEAIDSEGQALNSAAEEEFLPIVGLTAHW